MFRRVLQPRKLYGTVVGSSGGRWYSFPERFRGTFVERWKQYWTSVAKDYYEATAGVGTYAKGNPVKSSLIVAAATVAYYCAATNPDARSYRAELIDCANSMLYISPAVRNPSAVQHLELMEKRFNAGVVRTLNLLFFTVVWVDECDETLRAYYTTCKYLKPSILSVPERTVDIGFLNVWWSLKKIMIDYDVNPDEWKDHDKPE